MRGALSSYLLLAVLISLSLRQHARADERDPDAVTLHVTGATIDVSLPDETMKLKRQDLLNWVKASANAVSTYYGRFPVPHLTLKIRSSYGSGIRHGVTYATDGGLILVSVGRDTDVDDT